MKAENFNYDILKFVTNSNDYYVAGNGHIRRRDQNQAQSYPSSSQSNFRAAPPPPTNQYQAPRHVPVTQYQHVQPPPPSYQFQAPQHIPVVNQFNQGPAAPPPADKDPLENLFCFDTLMNSSVTQPTVRASHSPVHQAASGGAHSQQQQQ